MAKPLPIPVDLPTAIWRCVLCNAPVVPGALDAHSCPVELRIREIIREELIKSNVSI